MWLTYWWLVTIVVGAKGPEAFNAVRHVGFTVGV